jgi:uncharacterized membrane protein
MRAGALLLFLGLALAANAALAVVRVRTAVAFRPVARPIARTAAVVGTAAVTAAVVGSVVRSLPPNCGPISVGGVAYQQCGSTWYQPAYSGTTVNYTVVNPPQ